jgi:DNA-binding SARP family transcriptional activator
LPILLLHRDAPQNRSHLAFLLWLDSTEAQAHTNLRKLLYRLRQALPDIDQFLCIDKQTLQWRPAQIDALWTLDIQEMEQALAQAKQAEQTQDMSAQQQALEQKRDYDAALMAAQQLLRQDPLQEATYRQLMRLYAFLVLLYL